MPDGSMDHRLPSLVAARKREELPSTVGHQWRLKLTRANIEKLPLVCAPEVEISQVFHPVLLFHTQLIGRQTKLGAQFLVGL
jgi:hypothetical protein